MSGAVVPGPVTQRISGHVNEILADRVAFLQRVAREYGDIAKFRLWNRELYLVSDPECIKDILVTNHRNFHKSRALRLARVILGNGLLTSEDEIHRRQRKLMQPAFHSQRIAGYAEMMIDYAARQSNRWNEQSLDRTVVDIANEMMHLTLAIVAKTLFNADVEHEADEIGEALTTVLKLFDRIASPLAILATLIPTPGNIQFLLARNRLNKTIYRLIAERQSSGRDHGDLLSMMLAARDEDDDSAMTARQLRDEALTIMLAGHETTANALTWTWYLLSQNPEAEQKLHQELDEVLQGRRPTPADVSRLEYTRRVFSESMRLFPPAYAVGRKALEAYRIDDYEIPAGCPILMSPYIVHRDPRHWPDPDRFDPDRWTPDAQAQRHRFAYFPFGGGPRTCIGEQFAWSEGILLLATIAQYWRMQLVPGHPIALQPLITLRPKHGMRMTLLRRKPVPLAASVAS